MASLKMLQRKGKSNKAYLQTNLNQVFMIKVNPFVDVI